MPSAPASQDALFSPLQVGDITLGHRIVMAPLTRMRADNKHVLGGELLPSTFAVPFTDVFSLSQTSLWITTDSVLKFPVLCSSPRLPSSLLKLEVSSYLGLDSEHFANVVPPPPILPLALLALADQATPMPLELTRMTK